MNIWDSVHRGLEKASQEAARISKAQKLRSQIDALSRQLNTQNNTLLSRTIELFNNNQLTQSQLLPLCQELVNIQQQLELAQNELKLLQSQGVPPAAQTPPAGDTTGTYQLTSPYAAGEAAPTLYAPPPPGAEYQTQTTQVPPPPPGSGPQTVSAMETLLMGAAATPPPPPALPGSIRCIGCQGEIANGLSYCPNCGRPVQESSIAHLPTMRGGTLEPFYPPGQETLRSQTNSEQRAPLADQETVRGEAPPFENQPKKKDGGL
jgi:hypothetical protein